MILRLGLWKASRMSEVATCRQTEFCSSIYERSCTIVPFTFKARSESDCGINTDRFVKDDIQ
jgi:hypothetical protein